MLSLSRGAACFAVLASLAVPATALAAPPESKERRVLSKVHTDAVAVFHELGALKLATRADVGDEHGVRLDPDLMLFNVEDAARLTIPNLPEYSFLGAPGESSWIAPQTNPGGALLWPGFSTEGVALGAFDRDELTFSLERVTGPGRVDLYEVGGFGNVVRLLTDHGEAYRSWTRSAGQHIHANWAFSAPGRYVLRFGVRGARGGSPVSAVQDYVFHVGDVPAPVVTTTSLSASSSSVTVGSEVTLSAETSGGAGWVEFLRGTTSLGWKPVVDGRAELKTAALPLGTHDVVARFTPEWKNDFVASTSSALRVAVEPDTQTGVLRIDGGKAAYATGETMRLRAAGVTPASGQTLRWFYATDGTTRLYRLFTEGFELASGPNFALELSHQADQYYVVVQLLAGTTVLQQSAPFDVKVSGPSVGTGVPLSIDGFKAHYAAGEFAELTVGGEATSLRWIARNPLQPATVIGSGRSVRFIPDHYPGNIVYVQALDAAGAVIGQSPYGTLSADSYRMTIGREAREFYRAGETVEFKAELTPDNGRHTRYEWLQLRSGATDYTTIGTGRTLRMTMSEADQGAYIYVRLLEDDGDLMFAQSATLRLDVVPATGQTFYVKELAGHYHQGGSIALSAIADPVPAGASYRWYFKRADESAFRRLSVSAASHSLRAGQAIDGAQVYAELVDASGTVVATTEPRTIHVDDHGAAPNEVLSIGGLEGSYRPGARASLTAVVAPSVDLDRYEWWIMRRGGVATRVEGVTGPTFAFDTEVALDGATVVAKLVKNTGDVYLTSTPVTLSVAERLPARVGGTVPSLLGLALGQVAPLGTFIPGVAREYTAGASATVTSSLRDVALTVHDAAPEFPGRLVNGAHALAQPLRVSAGGDFAALGATPSVLTRFAQPLSAEPVALAFKQSIGAREPLDAGAYGKTLTFTLAPSTP